jgi:hypothetical protein
MALNRITIFKKPVSRVLRNVSEGRFAIPKLQREFVWDGPKAAKLLDSMNSHMPVGVVMIWQTARSQRLYLRQQYHVLPPFNARNGEVWFLIDGQQRISVLHHAREGDTLYIRGKEIDFRRVVLSLEKEEDGQQIRSRRPLPNRYEPMADILHPQWGSRLSHLGAREKERVRKCRQRILKYPMYFMFVQAKLDTVRETFLRINTQGMKIRTADAIFTKAESLDLRDFRHEVLQHVDGGFGLIPDMPILFAMAAVRYPKTEARGQALRTAMRQIEQKAKNDQGERNSQAKEWHKLGVCFGKAVDHLRESFRVLSRDYLYSDYMVAILAYFFYWNNRRGPSAKQKKQIQRWFWATTVGSRYSGRNFLRCLPADLKFFKRLARNGSARFSYTPEVDKVDVRKAQFASRTGITSAFYCMLLRRGPVSILDDGLNEIPLERYATSANRKDRHHVFPRAVLVGVGIPANLYNSISNICLLTADENQSIGSRRPRVYLKEVRDEGTYFLRKMKRHLLPVQADNGVWVRNVKRGFKRFLKERTELICKNLEEEAGMRLFRRDRDLS